MLGVFHTHDHATCRWLHQMASRQHCTGWKDIYWQSIQHQTQTQVNMRSSAWQKYLELGARKWTTQGVPKPAEETSQSASWSHVSIQVSTIMASLTQGKVQLLPCCYADMRRM